MHIIFKADQGMADFQDLLLIGVDQTALILGEKRAPSSLHQVRYFVASFRNEGGSKSGVENKAKFHTLSPV